MSDRKNQELVRRFKAGDQAAGAQLAGALLRAQSLLEAVSGLVPELQGALSAKVLGEKLKAEVIEAVSEGIDVGDLAGEIDMHDLATEIDVYEIASNVDTSDIASEVADNIDASEIAEHVEVDYDEVAESVSGRVVDHLDMDELATLVASKLEDKLEELVSEAVEEATS
jgi:hypothetical protein